MSQASYTLFETTLGACGIAWIEAPNSGIHYSITHLQLPEATPEQTAARIARNCQATGQSASPPAITDISNRIAKHLQGDLQDFRDVALDLSAVGAFVRRVCEVARGIPVGQTVTYASLAEKMGSPSLARAVGRALGMNPVPIIIPCHRVVAAHGKPGGFSAYGGRATKAKLLTLEGAKINLHLDLSLGD